MPGAKRSYRIWSPRYTHRSGGIRVLYRLAATLKSMGYEAAINEEPVNKDYIAVYPEIIPDPNPFHAERVVYFFLNFPSLTGVLKKFPPNGLNFYHSRFLNPPSEDFILTIPIVELDLFNLDNCPAQRDTTCSWVGKAGILKYMTGNPLGDNHITYRWPKTRPELAALLKRSKILYSYDGLSIIAMEAALCGCPTVIMLEGPFKREITQKTEYGTAGICWRIEDVEEARKSLPQALPNYLKVEASFLKQMENFITLTQGM